MKVFRFLLTLMLWVAGALLLIKPLSGQTNAAAPAPVAKAFMPTRFTVTDAGTAGKPDVVLIPGLGSSRAVWDGEVKLLAPHYRLHVLQVAGFAGAPAAGNAVAAGTPSAILPGIVEELHQYIVTTGIHPAVVGHSLGGLLAMMLADKHPEDVRKLVIVDTLPYYAVLFKPDATVDGIKPQAEVMRQQIIAAPADQFALMQQTVVPQLVSNPDGQKLVEAADIAGDRTVFADAMYEDLQTDLRGDIATIKTPTLMLYPFDPVAQKDATQVDAMYTGAYKPMPNVKLLRIDGSRHFIMYDQPAKLDAALEEFLK